MSNHEQPCNELTSFKKLVLGIMGLQTTFVVIALTIAVNIMGAQNAVNQRIAELSTKQKEIDKKAEDARIDASKALASSGKAESDIAWIREGLTELKLAIRESKYNKAERTP